MRLPLKLVAAFACSAAALLAACGGASRGSGTVAVRSFDDIRAGEVSFEADPSDPTRAIFRVTTTEPAICAIVWGPDNSFGRFNNSLSMNGTGITQHDVVLPDVEPGVTYAYVLQGTTADGTLYRSDVGTFTIEASPPVSTPSAVAPGVDITDRAVVTAFSSEFSTAFAATNAIDGDTATEWATRADGDNGWITLDFGSPIDITGFDFVTRSMADGSAVTSTYTVTIDDATSSGPYPSSTVAAPRPVALAARGQVLRFDVEQSTGGNVGAVEIRVYG